jgi:peptidyl-prolyl cis-trans isomerase SurA
MTCYANIIRFTTPFFLSITLFFNSSVQADNKVEQLNKVVAVVNNMIITQNELDQRIELAAQQDTTLSSKQALDELITEQLQLQRATERGLGISEAGLNKMLEHIAEQNKMTVSQLTKAIEQSGISLEEYKKSLKTQQIVSHLRQKEVLESVEVTPQEVEQFLKSAAQMAESQNAQNAQYHLGHILIPLAPMASPASVKAAHEQAKAIIRKLQNNQPVSLTDLGWRKMNELPTLFVKIVPSMNKLDIHGPIQNESGLHVIQLLDKQGSKTVLSGDLDTQKQQAFQIIRNRKANEKLTLWIQKLKDEAFIQSYLAEVPENAHAQTP